MNSANLTDADSVANAHVSPAPRTRREARMLREAEEARTTNEQAGPAGAVQPAAIVVAEPAPESAPHSALTDSAIASVAATQPADLATIIASRPARRFAVRAPRLTMRGAVKSGVLVACLGLGAVTALPAYAMTPTGTNPIASTVNAGGTFVPTTGAEPTQNLTIEQTAAPLAVSRDGYVATDPAELQAARDAEAAATASVVTASSASSTSASTWAAPQGYSGSAIVAYAEQFVGVVPYGWGANPNDSFGCDGLTQYVFGQFGISLPRGVDHQAALGTQISRSDAQAGDLVVWPGEHIGIYDGNGGIVHSPDFGRFVEHASSLWGSPIFVRL
jgi:cell wall-associated NlpC family hydrolase